MRRRSFLFGSVASLVPVPMLATPTLGSFDSRVTGLIVSDINPSVSVDHLLTALDVLVGRGIPVTCIVDPTDIDGKPMLPSHPLAQLLAAYALQSNAVEFAAIVPSLGAMKEYFQARAAREAINTLLQYLPQPGRESAHLTLSTLACLEIEAPLSPSGVRSAGVSMVLSVPAESSPVSSESWPNGIVRLFGGRKMNMRQYLSADVAAGQLATQSLLYISAIEIKGLSTSRLTAHMTALTDDILENERRGGSTAQYMRDLLWRDDYNAQRRLGIYLCAPPPNDPLAIEAIQSIHDDLLAEGYQVTVGGDGEDDLFWVTNKADPGGTARKKAVDRLVQVVPSCGGGALLRETVSGEVLGPGHLVKLTKVEEDVPGFDGCGHLHVCYRRIRHKNEVAAIRAIAGRSRDIVLAIEATAVATPAERTLLRRELRALRADGVSHIVPVREIAHVNFPRGAEIERQRRTQAALHRTKNQPRSQTAAWRSALMDDAKIAWQYFELYSNPSTGLCPATVNFTPKRGRIHQTVTMWDVGSQINGLVAANQLDLLTDKEFEHRISLILSQIRGRESQGRLLPQGWLVYDRYKWGNKDFDGSDAGRLLASLDNLRRHRFDDRLDELVSSWDLDQIIVDGRVHSVTKGQLVPAYRSHSAHYSARAFRRWGHEVRSPYEVFSDRAPYDGQMAILEAASWIGPIGAEPLLLEAMEIGMSAESAYLAEVLFAAQLEEFEETGRLVAVSEGPIDLEPWFTYQGLQLDAEKRTWAIDTVGGEPEFRKPSFWMEASVFSPKAAFLWSAYKPHEFSHRLLSYAREKAPTKSGFASSVFMKDGRATDTYSDINTNGVILEAIAKLLS